MITPRNIFFKLFLFCFFFSHLASKAQDLLVSEKNIGFNVGLNLALGTHFQRLGLNLNFYFVSDQFQANSEIRAYYNFKSLGPRVKHPEFVFSEGLVFSYGTKQLFYNPFMSSVANQTFYKNAVAYSYNVYVNKKRSTQQTGIVSLQFDSFSFITENDLLARPMYDRFRTAAALIQYQYEDQFQAAMNCSMWTGQMGRRTESKSSAFYSGCYMDTTEAIYANTSHGLLSAQFKYNAPYAQTIQINAGIDAEQIRNVVQNKFIHDMPFLPKKWNKGKNCHIPMLDNNGNQYLYEDGQKIRLAKLYLNAFSNANLFY